MSYQKNSAQEDEINLMDIWRFLTRQKFFIALFFTLFSLSVFGYAVTRPTTYESYTSVMVGEKLFFLQPQQQAPQQQIETADEIIYQYADNALITPVKKTRILKVSASAETQETSIAQVAQVVSNITSSHQKILDEKKQEFVRLLDLLDQDTVNRTELVKLLDNASSSSGTRQMAAISTERKPYGGQLLKLTGAGIAAGLFLALLLAVAKDFIEQRSQGSQEKSNPA